MASNVVVLDEGKKHTVKTTPMMTLKQIVKTVCEKQRYNDVDKYGLKLNRTILDLGLSVRFANLAPGAKLELIRTSTTKVHKDVQIALQIEDGGRIIETFPVTTTLWDILLHFEKVSENGSLNLTRRTALTPRTKKGFSLKRIGRSNELFYQQPVCLLLNQEYGTISTLKSTTLQSAGITSGNVALRLLFRHTELSLDNVMNDIGALPQPLEATEPVNEHITELSYTPESTTPIVSTEEANKHSEMQCDLTSVANVNIAEPLTNVGSNSDSQELETMETDDSNSNHVVTDTTEVDKLHGVQNQVLEGNDLLLPLPIEQETIDKGHTEQKTTDKVHSEQKMIDEEHTEQEMTNKGHTEQETTDNGQFDRDVKVFNPPRENIILSNQIDLPDSFYELTTSELQYVLAKQNSKRLVEENAGFKTSALRDQEEKEKERKYPKTLIRVRFPDGFQLQISFLSNETVAELYDFVKGTLRKSNCTFELYITPPKKTLSDRGLTLYQAGLAPASVVQFIWSDKSSYDVSCSYLSDEFLKLCEEIPHLMTLDDVSTTPIPDNSSIKFKNEGHTLSEPSSQRKDVILNKGKNSDDREESSSQSSRKLKTPKWFKKSKK